MKGKLGMFILNFAGYCMLVLIVKGWRLTTKEIAEMLFVGIWVSLMFALMYKPLKRFTENIVRKILS